MSAIQIFHLLESIAETTAIALRNAPKCDQAAANELIRVLDEKDENLMEKAPELLAEPPKIEKADVLADSLPG